MLHIYIFHPPSTFDICRQETLKILVTSPSCNPEPLVPALKYFPFSPCVDPSHYLLLQLACVHCIYRMPNVMHRSLCAMFLPCAFALLTTCSMHLFSPLSEVRCEGAVLGSCTRMIGCSSPFILVHNALGASSSDELSQSVGGVRVAVSKRSIWHILTKSKTLCAN